MKVKDYAPPELAKQNVFSKIYNAQDKQIDKLDENVQDLLNQFFVNTATWGLQYWEEEFGITPNINDTYEIRRSRLLAKKRGQGTTTKEVIKNICNSYVDDSEIIEHSKEYWFELILESYRGFPELDSLYEFIEEIKPAHLGTNYKLKAITKTDLRVVTVGLQGEIIKVFPWTPNDLISKVEVKIPLMNPKSLENIKTYPVKEGV